MPNAFPPHPLPRQGASGSSYSLQARISPPGPPSPLRGCKKHSHLPEALASHFWLSWQPRTPPKEASGLRRVSALDPGDSWGPGRDGQTSQVCSRHPVRPDSCCLEAPLTRAQAGPQGQGTFCQLRSPRQPCGQQQAPCAQHCGARPGSARLPVHQQKPRRGLRGLALSHALRGPFQDTHLSPLGGQQSTPLPSCPEAVTIISCFKQLSVSSLNTHALSTGPWYSQSPAQVWHTVGLQQTSTGYLGEGASEAHPWSHGINETCGSPTVGPRGRSRPSANAPQRSPVGLLCAGRSPAWLEGKRQAITPQPPGPPAPSSQGGPHWPPLTLLQVTNVSAQVYPDFQRPVLPPQRLKKITGETRLLSVPLLVVGV